MPSDPHRVFGRSALWLFFAGLVAALVLPFSADLAGMQDADGVLTAIISTQKLTWYFWGQDRLLNFIPALAWPFRDPATNLHVQIAVRTFMAFLAPIGVMVFYGRLPRVALLVTVVTQAVLVLCLGQYALFNLYVQHNPFGTSLVLFAMQVAVLARWPTLRGTVVALVIGFLAYATNLALLTFSFPLIALALLLAIKPRAQLLRLLGIQCVSVALAWGHARHFGEGHTNFGVAPSWKAIVDGFHVLGNYVNLPALAVLFVLATVALAVRPSRVGLFAWLIALGFVPAVAALSCLVWTQQGIYDVRYYLTFVLVFATSCVYLVINVVEPYLRPIWVGGMAAVIIAGMFFIRLGGVSATPDQLVDARWRGKSEAIAKVAVDEHVDLIAGEFWDVWPAILDTREALIQAGRADERVFGATFRGHVVRNKINRVIASRGSARSLCLLDSLTACIKETNDSLLMSPRLHVVPETVRSLDVGGRAVLVYEVRPD